MGQGSQRIKLSLTKPLQRLLDQRDQQERLQQRVAELEQRLDRLEHRGMSVHPAPSTASTTNDAGIFFTDADEPPAMNDRQRTSYEAWHQHFTHHPDEIEPGRTAHEMAALRAATQSPIK